MAQPGPASARDHRGDPRSPLGERAALNARFVDSDVAQFQQTARELELLLRNSSLLSELESEQRALRVANEELERRVAARTRELALANEGLARTLVALSAREAHVAEDIAQAREFQQKLLPALPVVAGIEFASVYRPLEQVGGDVFDIWQRGPDLSGSIVRRGAPSCAGFARPPTSDADDVG